MFLKGWNSNIVRIVLILALLGGSFGFVPVSVARAATLLVTNHSNGNYDIFTPTGTATETNTSTYTPTPSVFVMDIQPAAAAGQDSYIYSGSKTTNYGSAVDMGVG
jgi:hypothetical protein